MDKTPNLGLNRYTFKDLADARKLTEDNDILDLLGTSKLDTQHKDDNKAHQTLFDEIKKSYVKGKFEIIQSLDDLGITVGSETIPSIIRAMKDCQELHLHINKDLNSNPEAFPVDFGYLIIRKLSIYRSLVILKETYTFNIWIAEYYEVDNDWRGWQKILLEDKDKKIAYLSKSDATNWDSGNFQPEITGRFPAVVKAGSQNLNVANLSASFTKSEKKCTISLSWDEHDEIKVGGTIVVEGLPFPPKSIATGVVFSSGASAMVGARTVNNTISFFVNGGTTATKEHFTPRFVRFSMIYNI